MKYEKKLVIGGARAAPPPQTDREQNRSQNAKRHRKRRKKNRTLYYILLGIIITVTLIILSFTYFFNIKEIVVSENGIFTANEIIEASGLKLGNNLLRINKKRAENKILSSTIFLDAVEIKREFPSRLSIELDIAEPVIGFNYGRLYYFFSEKDRLIEISKTNTHPETVTFWGVDLNKIKLGEYLTITEESEIETAKTIIKALVEQEFSGIATGDLRDMASVKLYYNEKIEIKLGGMNELEYKLKLAKEVIEEKLVDGEKGILDAQIVGKVYFKADESVKLPS